jgi:hypothetical protein
MKLYIESDDGAKIEFDKVEVMPNEAKILFFYFNRQLSSDAISKITKQLNSSTKKECIVLCNGFTKVTGIEENENK